MWTRTARSGKISLHNLMQLSSLHMTCAVGGFDIDDELVSDAKPAQLAHHWIWSVMNNIVGVYRVSCTSNFSQWKAQPQLRRRSMDAGLLGDKLWQSSSLRRSITTSSVYDALSCGQRMSCAADINLSRWAAACRRLLLWWCLIIVTACSLQAPRT